MTAIEAIAAITSLVVTGVIVFWTASTCDFNSQDELNKRYPVEPTTRQPECKRVEKQVKR